MTTHDNLIISAISAAFFTKSSISANPYQNRILQAISSNINKNKQNRPDDFNFVNCDCTEISVLMLSLPKYKVFSVTEAYWPHPPSPTGVNLHCCFCIKTFKNILNTLHNFTFMETMVLRKQRGSARPPPPSLVKDLDTKRLGKGRVKYHSLMIVQKSSSIEGMFNPANGKA